jgi:hypothetical protein
MSKFDQFWNGIRDGLPGLVGDFAKGAKDQAIGGMKTFLDRSRADLERWSGMLEKGDLSFDEFQSLLKGMKDAGEIRAIRVAGVTLARVQRLRDQLIDLLVKSATGAFLP